MGDKHNLHCSHSSSSSSQRTSQIYDNQRQQQMGSCLDNRYDPTTLTVPKQGNSKAAAAPKQQQLDLIMKTFPRNDVSIEKEHMFDKAVTPSDVGKLNRLVIPKQHAEKYFPLDSSTKEKDLLLNFEDSNGKLWRFRYSYWNSSQSYVMTKGWSRFVKDKKLDAGDIVSFQRGVGELGKYRLFIEWRRRPDGPLHQHHQLPFQYRSIPSLMRPPVLPLQINNFYIRNSYYNGSSYDTSNLFSPDCKLGSVFYLRSQPAHPQGERPVVFDSVPVVQGKAAAKRLRLFGVNMDCPITEADECDILSSTMAIQPSQLSASSQLRLYNGTPMPALPPFDFLNKGNASMSFDSGL